MPFSVRPYRVFPLTYFSGFMLLIVLLVLSSGAAYAEWVAIGSTDDGMAIYADPDTIRRKDEMVKMWILFDFKATQTVAGHLILSIKGQE